MYKIFMMITMFITVLELLDSITAEEFEEWIYHIKRFIQGLLMSIVWIILYVKGGIS